MSCSDVDFYRHAKGTRNVSIRSAALGARATRVMGQLALAVTEKEWDVVVLNFVFSKKELTVVSFSLRVFL